MLAHKIHVSSDYTDHNSIAFILRKKRFDFFSKLLEPYLDKDISILDIGGTSAYWEELDSERTFERNNIRITLVNRKVYNTCYSNMISVIGDAKDLSQFDDNSFDVIYSNSVIQCIGGYDAQLKMASEVKRLSNKFFIQTPNLFFPVEPHYGIPLFQYLPKFVQAYFFRKFKLGSSSVQNFDDSFRKANRVRLLTLSELKKLFPQSEVYRENIFGLTKSFTLYRGFNQ